MFVSRIHTYFLSMNDQFENSFTDKELHFLIIGAFGLALILVLHPIFLWLARTGHTMWISFFYVFTVILVLTFAIEIGQGFYGTGVMELDDVQYGVTGFLVFFLVFAIIRAIVHFFVRAGKGRQDQEEQNPADNDYF